MTKWFRVLHPDGSIETVAAADDEDRPGGDWEGCALIELDREPGEFDAVDDEGAVALDVAKLDAVLHAQIDSEAGAFRCRFITAVPGQELTYLRKEAEARDYLAGGSGPWPMLTAQVDATSENFAALAIEVIARADEWIVLGSQIEALRMAAKISVTGATTAESKRAAAVVDWAAIVTT